MQNAVDVQIQTFPLGPLETNSYVVANSGKCWLIDIGGPIDRVVRFVTAQKLELETMIITHSHWDHIAGLGALKKQYPQVPVAIHKADAQGLSDGNTNLSSSFAGRVVEFPPADVLLADGQGLQLGSSNRQVLHCPGHTPGNICLYCPAAQVVIVGDVLFAGGVGRTDMPGGSAEQLLASIRDKLLVLPEQTAVLPGHGPATTIGKEKATNPWL